MLLINSTFIKKSAKFGILIILKKILMIQPNNQSISKHSWNKSIFKCIKMSLNQKKLIRVRAIVMIKNYSNKDKSSYLNFTELILI